MWLCAQNKILTNTQRKKMTLISELLCPICRTEESVIHALRDCPASKDAWKLLIKPTFWPKFFYRDTIDQFTFNSRRELGKIESINWKITFVEVVRRLWLRRNAFIFRHEQCTTWNTYWNIIQAAREFENAMGMLRFSNLVWREISIKWQPSKKDWIKCNLDGASTDDRSATGCGGLIRDSTGKWRLGFTMGLEEMDGFSQKVWSIATRLIFAWEEGHRCVCLELDLKKALEMIRNSYTADHLLASLFWRIDELRNREWMVRFGVCYREENESAHWLATEARGQTSGRKTLEDPPKRLRSILEMDLAFWPL